MVSRSLMEFQVRVHRRDAEDTEAAQSPESTTLRPLCGLGASAVKMAFAELRFAQNRDAHPRVAGRFLALHQ
jgi:hypothetical protein